MRLAGNTLAIEYRFRVKAHTAPIRTEEMSYIDWERSEPLKTNPVPSISGQVGDQADGLAQGTSGTSQRRYFSFAAGRRARDRRCPFIYNARSMPVALMGGVKLATSSLRSLGCVAKRIGRPAEKTGNAVLPSPTKRSPESLAVMWRGSGRKYVPGPTDTVTRAPEPGRSRAAARCAAPGVASGSAALVPALPSLPFTLT